MAVGGAAGHGWNCAIVFSDKTGPLVPVKPGNNEFCVLVIQPIEFNACTIVHSGSEGDSERIKSFAFLKEASGYN